MISDKNYDYDCNQAAWGFAIISKLEKHRWEHKKETNAFLVEVPQLGTVMASVLQDLCKPLFIYTVVRFHGKWYVDVILFVWEPQGAFCFN